MKKATFFIILVLLFALSSCASPMISETGFDLSELESCIDAIIDQESSLACDMTERKELLKDYIQSFEVEFDATDTIYNMSDLEFTQGKDGSMRFEYWFQYGGLAAGLAETHYEAFKEIMQTQVLEMREMNSEPEFLVNGEFLMNGNISYKYHSNNQDQLLGEVLLLNSTIDFATLYTDNESYLTTYGLDDELIEQKLTIVSSDFSVQVIVDIVNSTYSYIIYNVNNEDTTTTLEVETMVETTFNNESLTLTAWSN
jgi:hypothetical protein